VAPRERNLWPSCCIWEWKRVPPRSLTFSISEGAASRQLSGNTQAVRRDGADLPPARRSTLSFVMGEKRREALSFASD